ncbi:MAG: CoA-binding protein [Sandaracinaceae bacterium]|jgi:predicted CoA-binding protein|nr:CoA-binding protein [Sandaracinaceae bacterium]MBP7680552.1 CoA-binding protein [Deltaproteobacteria bacterium]MBK6808653.1 CoA-binding protein [Sandaracinaceae bacterium]MBK7150225.1 CoA-binding protein [Sandaracinaceae bacterium]MBK7774292.1 CoA-binding protein [Sandaracinaceae bacterium]
MTSPHPLLITEPAQIGVLALDARRVAVLGIKPDSHRDQPAYYVPAYLDSVGIEVIPVPVYYPEVKEILGLPVERDLRRLRDIDICVVFRRSEDVADHVPALIAMRPKCVWMQSGIRDDEAALTLAKAGIAVVQDRCIMVEHRRARL